MKMRQLKKVDMVDAWTQTSPQNKAAEQARLKQDNKAQE
jgi:hypothetical protein